MQSFKNFSLYLLLTTILSVNIAQGAVSKSEASKLGKSLTPFGALTKGNKSGTIPRWDGGIDTPLDSYAGPGTHHTNPFNTDKPLFEITTGNMDKYAGTLTDGQKALFKAYPKTFRLPIYQTRRSHAAPDWVYKNTKKNALTASLVNGGSGVENAYGGIPFPIAKNGLEVIWNHILRWRSEYAVRRTGEATVQPNGNYAMVIAQDEVLFNYYTAGSHDKLDNIIFYYLSFNKSPARLAGGAVLVHETLNQNSRSGGEPRLAWGYNAGQRRVRRAPNLAFDSPVAEASGLHAVDEIDMYNGTPERFNWKLKGRQEIYVPYNSYSLASDKLQYKDILQTGHLNPDYTRYELHRVWVVEATLKKQKRHIYSKRVFYIDEDSWSILLAEQYNSHGELWRVNACYTKNFYELPSTFPVLDVYHDLLARQYHVRGLDNEEGSTLDFSREVPNKRYFKPAALRRRGRR